MAEEWYILNAGKKLGPVSASHLQQLARQGKVTPETQVAKDRNGPWVAAARLNGLFPAIVPAPVVSATPHAAPPPPRSPSSMPSLDDRLPSADEERVIWTGQPSQIVNLGVFIVCGLLFWLVIPILIALWQWLVIRCTNYELTSQRFRVARGVLSRRTDELELYRVKDTVLDQPFFLRIFSLASILISSSDVSSPQTAIQAIPFTDAKRLREITRTYVEQLRDRKRVREVDFI